MKSANRSFVGFTAVALLFFSSEISIAEETFVTIHGVSGNRIAVTPEGEGGRRGRRGGQAAGMESQNNQSESGSPRGRGRGRGRARGGANSSANQQLVLVVPATAKITSALRERRTFEFRVGAELPGGLRNRVFTEMNGPLSARIVMENDVITEINVMTTATDINQSNTNSSGSTVIAVRPKRPPMKKK